MSAPQHRHATEEKLVQLTFPLKKSDWYEHASETLWAEPVGDNTFRLRNVPFYAYGASYDDVVRAINHDHRLMVQDIVQRGGHSTYRLFVTDTERLKRFREFWQPLKRIGCTLERATDRLIAVDVPAEADIYTAYAALRQGEAAGVWDFEEAHVGHTLRAPQ
jgi:Domain of unknown function (DUF4265)